MSNFIIIGHRGYGPTHFLEASTSLNESTPENSLPAFKYALDMGADGIEMDVQVTADGIPIVLHDQRLQDHIIDPNDLPDKDFNALTFSEIKDLNIGGGHKIPSLEEVLVLTSQYDRKLFINLDVKDPRSTAPVLAILSDFENTAENKFVVSSYDWDLLRKYREASPTIALVPAIKTELLFGSDNVGMPGYVPLTDTYDATAKSILKEFQSEIGFVALDCTFSDLRPELMNWAAELGVGLQISTGKERVSSSKTDYQALAALYKAMNDNSNIPFVACKVDEPDKVVHNLRSVLNASLTNAATFTML